MIAPSKSAITETDNVTPHDPDAKMTGDQADLLRVLCEKAGEPFDGNLTQGQAMARIEELREHLNSEQNL